MRLVKADMDIDFSVRFVEETWRKAEGADDMEMLEFALEAVKIAAQRLDSDLDDPAIRKEYNKICRAVNILQDVKENYC